MADGLSLESAMKQSIEDLDGVFTYLVVTDTQLGMAKDVMAAKPLVLHQGDDLVALASEEGAIRAVVDHEIDSYDPYEGEVMVWSR
jgi:glutamine phosphoribosylpyrophosphate amidotransferase